VTIPRNKHQQYVGRTIRYLRGGGGLGKYQKKIQKKNIVYNKPIEKKNRARTRGDFYRKIIYVSSPPFLGHLKKNIVQRNVVEKKFLQGIGG
jgi:hypothetical protein